MPRRLIQALLFIFGISIPLPIFLIPNQQFSLRLTDLALVLVLPAAWASIRSHSAARACLLVAAFAAAALLLSLATLAPALEFNDFAFYGRWLFCVFATPALCILFATDEDVFSAFLCGLVAGAGAHVVTLVAADLGQRTLLLQIGLASPRSPQLWAGGQERIITLAEHPNQTMSLISLALPSALALYLLGRNQWPTLIAGILIVVAGFHYTLSRSSVVAIGVALIYFCSQVIEGRRLARYSLLAAGLAAWVICFIWANSKFGWHLPVDRYVERFDATILPKNFGGRFESWVIGIAFIASHPFGIGWSRFLDAGPELPYGGATHNGFIFAGRTAGLIVGLGLLYGQLRIISAIILRRLALPAAPLYVYVFVLGWSEDITQGTSFTFLACLVAAQGILFGARFCANTPSINMHDLITEAPPDRQKRMLLDHDNG